MTNWKERFAEKFPNLVASIQDTYGIRFNIEPSDFVWFIDAELQTLIEAMEGEKGWNNCVVGSDKHGTCEECANRQGFNAGLQSAIDLIKQTLK